MKYLILDTNVYVRDFQMGGHNFNAIISNHGLVAEKFGIPKVVADEVISQLEKKVKTEIDIIKKSSNKLRRYVGEICEHIEQKEISHIANEYETFFYAKLLDTNFEFIDYPTVSPEDLAERAMSRRKPFKSNGEGICDAIIWETIVHLLESDSMIEIVFVSDNTKDFCDDRGLHGDLLDDLAQKKISENRIAHYFGIDQVVKTLVLPHLENLEDLQNKLTNNLFVNLDFNDWLSNRLYEELDPAQVGFSLYDITSNDCELYLSEVYEIKSLEVGRVRAISESSRYVRINAEIGVSLEICTNYGQHEDHPFLEKLFNSWNAFPSPYDCATKSDYVEVVLTLLFENEDIGGGSIEISSITGINSKVQCI